MGLFDAALPKLPSMPTSTKGWKTKLRPASFRGVPFYVDSSQFTGGRRNVFHEFPDRDSPYSEDIGKAGRVFKVEGHILGDDYFEIKTRLLAAVEKAGPGELVHPYFGTLYVQCGAVSIDEDTKEGRIAKVSFQFYEAGDNRFPKSVNDKDQLLQDRVANAIGASQSAFDKAFSIAKASGSVVTNGQLMIRKALGFMKSPPGSGLAGQVANLAYLIRNTRAEITDLMASPGKLSQRLLDAFSLLGSAIEGPEERQEANYPFTRLGDDDAPVPGSTPSRERERENAFQFNNFMRRVATAKAVETSAQISYASVDEALKAREELSEMIEDVLQKSDDDAVFAAFEDLNASLVQILPDDDSDLPNIRKVKLNDTLPSLVVAYDFFERSDAEEDLILRNKIKNPGFIVGGTELEILNVRKDT